MTADWQTDQEMPSSGNEYEGDARKRWGEIFYRIDPQARIAQQPETYFYRMTFLLSSGIKFTVRKPSRPKRDWHETLWEIYHTTAYVDSRGRDWSEGSEYGLSHIGIRPWARPAATIAEDIKRRAVEPALRDHEANLQKIEQINEGIRRQVHTAKIVRQVLGNTTPSAMYPNQDVIYYGQRMTAKIQVFEGGTIQITNLEFTDPETALEALETLFQKYEQPDQ